MSNNSKVLLLQNKQIIKNKNKVIKKEKNQNLSKELLVEIEKLKKPKNGQIYVYLQNDDYLFYQFNGKEWMEIK